VIAHIGGVPGRADPAGRRCRTVRGEHVGVAASTRAFHELVRNINQIGDDNLKKMVRNHGGGHSNHPQVSETCYYADGASAGGTGVL
jgi:hypothetical protein